MNQPVPTGPDLFAFAEASFNKARSAGSDPDNPTFGSPEELYHFRAADFHAKQAQTAAVVMLAEVISTATGANHRDFEGWREKIGVHWIKECWGKEIRRPQCEERHTEDCTYADPVPEPEHVLLSVGTRVLVSDGHAGSCNCGKQQPYVGRIAGYDMHRSKYQISEECYGTPGEYYSFVRWAFADNRVQVHPDGPQYMPTSAPEPVKKEPTGPRIYVENDRGKQGYLVDVYHHEKDGTLWYTVQFFSPGAKSVRKRADSLTVIAESQVERCPNGQTRDECESGENQCEPCRQAEDEEGDEIERSMGLR